MLRLEEKIREIGKRRKIIGLTQKELAGRSGVSQSLVAKLESGKIDPSYSSVQKIETTLAGLEKLGLKKDLNAGDIMNCTAISVGKDEKVTRAVKIMWKHGFSQLPVFESVTPVGSISEDDVLRAHEKYGKERVKKLYIKEIMNGGFPIINENTGANSIKELLKENKAILVAGRKKFGIITKSDFLGA